MNMGPDDPTADGSQSWDGRKTADFAKVSNDGLWTWDGSEWTPRKKGVIQGSNDQLSQGSSAKPDEINSPIVPIQNQQTVKEVVTIETGSISPDGHYQWDGGKWIPVELTKLSDDGVWMWDGKEWIPNPDRAVDKEEPTQPQFQQMQNTQVAQYPGYGQNAQMLLIQQTKKSKSGLWISLVIILPILFVAFTIIMAGVLYVWASDLAEEQDQTDLAGTWYNNADTMTLYSNGSVDESAGIIIEWSSEGDNLTTTFLIDGEEIDLIWKYEIRIDSDDDRILFMAYFDEENGVQTNEVAENSCIVYVDSVKGTEEDYIERKRAIIPDWCEFVEE
tara:strand:- start:110 stop:1105 length:996 start_codon:yes stop_codon:yes gene_type:complete